MTANLPNGLGRKRKDGMQVGSRFMNKFYNLEFFDEEDWWACGAYDSVSGIDEQLIARCLGYTDHPTGDTFGKR
jgi:hypothetical protein